MPKQSRKTNSPGLCVQRLTVMVNGTTAIENVSFVVPKGSMTAIVGPNGSGKTTLLRAVLGLIEKTHGTVTFFGEDIRNVRRRVGYVPQHLDFDHDTPVTAAEFLWATSSQKPSRARIKKFAAEFGVSKHMLRQSLGTLSGGELQRVLLTGALMHGPDIVLLDEPGTGVDLAGEAELMRILEDAQKMRGMTVIMVSHDLHMVAQAVDHVVCLNRRVVCEGSPKVALTTEHLNELYGANAVHIDHTHSAYATH